MDNKQNRRKSISSIANVAQALSLGHRRLHCKLLVTDALECKALNCYVPTALLCTQWGLLGEHHIHGVALAAHFGVTLAEPGVLLPDPMAVTGPSHPFPRPGPGHGHFHERPPVGQHYLGLHPGPLRLVGAPSLGPAGAGTRAAPAPGQGWAPGGPSYGAALVLRSTGWSWPGGTTSTM